jgi:hypothetical protein
MKIIAFLNKIFKNNMTKRGNVRVKKKKHKDVKFKNSIKLKLIVLISVLIILIVSGLSYINYDLTQKKLMKIYGLY